MRQADLIDVRQWERDYGEKRERRAMPRSATKIFRSRDYRAIRDLATDSRIFPQISDDYTRDVKLWKPIESELVIYLLASDDEGPFGFGIFVPKTHVEYAAHTAFLPRSYGAQARHSFEEMIRWMWKETRVVRIVGEIVRSNTLAIRFARQAGFEIYGVNKRSFLRGGVLHDQVCLGISKPATQGDLA
jgi:RimJ/RimL family protein N-acetyltransferase